MPSEGDGNMDKVVRTISWRIYAAALAITAVVFVAGVYAGAQIERSTLLGVSSEIEAVNAKMLSLETMLFFEGSPFFCDFFSEEMGKFDSETAGLGEKIGLMEQRSADPQLKADYMLLEFRDYLLAKEIGKRCNQSVNMVLYFLSSSNCAQCLNQGRELDEARESISNLRVYSFDADVPSTIVSSLKKEFGIEEYPTLVVNGRKYAGLTPANKIIAALSAA